MTARMFYRLLHWLTDVKIPQNAGDFRLIDRAASMPFCKWQERDRFVRGMFCVGWVWTNSRYVNRDARARVRPKYTFAKCCVWRLMV